MGGMGKSTLATRAASRLQDDGFELIGIKVQAATTPEETGRRFLREKLLPALAHPFVASAPKIVNSVFNPDLPLALRVNSVLSEWRRRRVALVIDNFEDVLDLATRQIVHADLRTVYERLVGQLNGDSRLIVTCRYLPANTPDSTDYPHLGWFDLKDMKEFEVRKFLRRDPKVEQRLRAGEISDDHIAALHRMFGGTPGFLTQVRTLFGAGKLAD
jgi:hypothetical protein